MIRVREKQTIGLLQLDRMGYVNKLEETNHIPYNLQKRDTKCNIIKRKNASKKKENP